MKYPKNLQNNSKIGVVALSAGVGEDIEDYKKSISNIEKQNFGIIETGNVRSCLNPSTDAQTRAKELDRLVVDDDVVVEIF